MLSKRENILFAAMVGLRGGCAGFSLVKSQPVFFGTNLPFLHLRVKIHMTPSTYARRVALLEDAMHVAQQRDKARIVRPVQTKITPTSANKQQSSSWWNKVFHF